MLYCSDLDGKNTEGLGSVLQLYLHLYAYGKINNKEILLPKFQNLNHYQHENISKDEFHLIINDFFSFQSDLKRTDEIKFIEPEYLLRYFGEINLKKKKNYISELSRKINYKSIKYFNSNKTISVHIRNQNKLDTDFNLNREYLNNEKHKFYIKLIENLINQFPEYEIHIFSQGHIEEFKFLNNFSINFHLNTPLIETFYHLITSKILVTSNSSLSWTAHLFGLNQKVYSRSNFFHSWYPSTILISKNGKPKGKLFSYLEIQLRRLFFLLYYIVTKKRN